MGPQLVLPHRVRVDLGVMSMKGYSTFPKAPELEPHHQMGFSIMSRTYYRESYPTAEVQLVYSTVPTDRAGIQSNYTWEQSIFSLVAKLVFEPQKILISSVHIFIYHAKNCLDYGTNCFSLFFKKKFWYNQNSNGLVSQSINTISTYSSSSSTNLAYCSCFL